MHIDVEQFLDSIPIMLKGFLGVFLILGIIIITTVFLNAVMKKESFDPHQNIYAAESLSAVFFRNRLTIVVRNATIGLQM